MPGLHSLLLDLPDDIELLCCYHDQAALCLASPPLGLAALRQLPMYTGGGPLLSVAIMLHQHSAASVLDEGLLRRYAAHDDASAEGCAWLAAAAQREHWPLHISTTRPARPNFSRWHLQLGFAQNEFVLLRVVCPSGIMRHYEGAESAERLVRAVLTSGTVRHYEGAWGAERLVRAVLTSGTVRHYEGAEGAERLVRAVFPSGTVDHFAGAEGAERLVRAVLPSGTVDHFEGAWGAEQLVRAVFPSGIVMHYKGRKGRRAAGACCASVSWRAGCRDTAPLTAVHV
jgi:hypothetical protein